MQVERVELTSRKHSSSPTLTICSSTKPMPTHDESFYSHSRILHRYRRYSSLTGTPTALQHSPSQGASISSPQGGWRPPHTWVPLLPLLSLSPPTLPRLPRAMRTWAAARRCECPEQEWQWLYSATWGLTIRVSGSCSSPSRAWRICK
jgi:hypothetical protein